MPLPYSTIKVTDLDPSMIESWKEKGIVYLVGSYVSVFPPTNLPAGWIITRALWDRILRKSDWDVIGEDLEYIPFEAVMQCYPNRSVIRPTIQKLFSGRDPNPIHRCLLSSLQSGVATALLTTNYDLAFDSLAASDSRIATVYDQPSHDRYKQLHSASTTPPKLYFKIHGTAAAGAESTIVCDLEAEGWPEEWKRELLFEATRGRVLVVIGYSGRDFDICPDLANFTNQAQTVWLQHRRDDVQPNARRVLHGRGGTLVEGDLIPFLRTLLDPTLAVADPLPQVVSLDDFDVRCTGEWRLNLLSWIACPTLLSRSFSELKDKRAIRQSLYAGCGRYRDAIRECKEEIATSTAEGIRQALGLVSARFIYGQHIRTWTALNRLDKEIAKHSSLPDDLRALPIEVRMIMYMRTAQVARALRMAALSRYIQRKAKPAYQQARTILQHAGAWGRLEALQQNAERIGIAAADGLPLPARRGYRSLGLVSMDIIMRRDWIRSGRWRLSTEKQKMALEYIAKAESYGWHHEAWKLNWIMLWRGRGNKKLYFREWRKHFRETQYPALARILQLLLNLVPSGSEHEFDSDDYWKP